jgi:hypothetical protein
MEQSKAKREARTVPIHLTRSIMQTPNRICRRSTFNNILLLGIAFVFGLVPKSLIMGEDPATKPADQQKSIDQQEKIGFGRFASYQNQILILESNEGTLLAWHNLTEKTQTLEYDPSSNDYKRVSDPIAALNKVKVGTYMMVGPRLAYIRIGARHDAVVGTFVSFKNDRLLMFGKSLPDSFIKRYGNNLQYNKFRDDVPVYESVDGGEYKQIGTANKILNDAKEGILLTIHGEGDDNITRVDIGLPKKN